MEVIEEKIKIINIFLSVSLIFSHLFRIKQKVERPLFYLLVSLFIICLFNGDLSLIFPIFCIFLLFFEKNIFLKISLFISIFLPFWEGFLKILSLMILNSILLPLFFKKIKYHYSKVFIFLTVVLTFALILKLTQIPILILLLSFLGFSSVGLFSKPPFLAFGILIFLVFFNLPGGLKFALLGFLPFLFKINFPYLEKKQKKLIDILHKINPKDTWDCLQFLKVLSTHLHTKIKIIWNNQEKEPSFFVYPLCAEKEIFAKLVFREPVVCLSQIQLLYNEISLFFYKVFLHQEKILGYLEVLKDIYLKVEDQDRYRAGHSREVGKLMESFAKTQGLNENFYRLIGEIHDIGFIGINEQITHSVDMLKPQEFEQIKKHVFVGKKICQKLSCGELIENAVFLHHARDCNFGYPKNQDNIPYIAKVLAIADTAAAQKHFRPYRRSRENEEIIKELKYCRDLNCGKKLLSLFEKIIS